jgi:hypothetical protein
MIDPPLPPVEKEADTDESDAPAAHRKDEDEDEGKPAETKTRGIKASSASRADSKDTGGDSPSSSSSSSSCWCGGGTREEFISKVNAGGQSARDICTDQLRSFTDTSSSGDQRDRKEKLRGFRLIAKLLGVEIDIEIEIEPKPDKEENAAREEESPNIASPIRDIASFPSGGEGGEEAAAEEAPVLDKSFAASAGEGEVANGNLAHDDDDDDNMSQLSFGGELHSDADDDTAGEAGEQATEGCFVDKTNTSRHQWSKLAGAVKLFGSRWRAHVDETTDYVYYEEAATGHVQWHKPEDFDGDAIEGHLHQES